MILSQPERKPASTTEFATLGGVVLGIAVTFGLSRLIKIERRTKQPQPVKAKYTKVGTKILVLSAMGNA